MKHVMALNRILVPAVAILVGCRSPASKKVVPMPPGPQAAAAPASTVQRVASAVEPIVAPQPAAIPQQLKQERRDMEVKIDRLEESIAEQRKLQTRLNNELNELQRKIAVVQAQVQQVEIRATQTARKIEEGETGLAGLKNDLARRSGGTPASVEKAPPASALAEPASRPASIPVSSPDPMAPPAVASQPVAAAPAMSARQMVVVGNRLLREGKPNEAEPMFSGALAKDPFLVKARLGLASCRYAHNDLVEAKRLADDVIQVDPRNAEALGLAGIVAWRQNDLKLATALLESAIRQDPKDARWHNYMGIVRYAQGKRSHAMDELEIAVAMNPNLAEAHFNLALIMATEDRPQMDAARQHYQAALRLGNARDGKLEGILYQ